MPGHGDSQNLAFAGHSEHILAIVSSQNFEVISDLLGITRIRLRVCFATQSNTSVDNFVVLLKRGCLSNKHPYDVDY